MRHCQFLFVHQGAFLLAACWSVCVHKRGAVSELPTAIAVQLFDLSEAIATCHSSVSFHTNNTGAALTPTHPRIRNDAAANLPSSSRFLHSTTLIHSSQHQKQHSGVPVPGRVNELLMISCQAV